MGIVPDILATWAAPRRALRARLARSSREDQALATLMGAAVLIFVAQWPRLAREASLDPSVPLDARLGGALIGVIFILPLIAYVVAAASHLIARAFGGKGSHFSARVALFWALLAAAPAFLLHGLAAGFLGQGVQLNLLGFAVLGGFLYLWLAGLWEAER